MLSRLSFLNRYGVWALFALPGGFMLGAALASDDPRIFHELVHPTGEFSARFLIVAMMATPLAMLLRGWRGPIWLKKNRRYLGVASFGYACCNQVKMSVVAQSRNVPLGGVRAWLGWVETSHIAARTSHAGVVTLRRVSTPLLPFLSHV